MIAKEQDIPVIGTLLRWIIGSRNERFVNKYLARVRAINELEPRVRTMTDAELAAKVVEFRERVSKGTKADDLQVEAFAVAREAMDRAVGIRNVFNPAAKFDAGQLPARERAMYEEIKARAEATAPIEPEGEWLGHHTPIPGWMQVEIPPEMYEAVRQIYPESRPPFRARPFDVQLVGGMVLGQGKIAEMRTGEGKTIVAPLACYMACIERRKVHVVTVNDYLVQRDRDWTFPYFHALGLTVGAIHPQHIQNEDVKRRMYRCDVVYGTTAEFGFDYLRDNMKRSVDQQVQRRRDFAIVDEVDSILIDEARTPLIISGPAHDYQPRYALADKLARHLLEKQRPWQQADDAVQHCLQRIKGYEGDIRQARDKASIPEIQAKLKESQAELPRLEAARRQHTQFYETQLERKQCHLTHDGIAEAQRVAGVGSFYVDENFDMPHLLEQSLRAHAVYQRDKDYVIMPAQSPQTGRTEMSVVIVDVFTGRPMVGRSWSDGLHQAVECKEGVTINQETQTVASITIQNFFKMYKRLAGMTGTADTEAQEFHDIYHLDVVSIPTNKPVIRRDFDDLMFMTGKDKWNAIVDEIKGFHDVGRPILVGTTSVSKSEELSKMLMSKHGIKHEVLNAKQHEREAHIVENAGQLGQVMIATNMAGRGTDIKLGAVTREALLEHWLRRGIAPRAVTVDMSDEQLREQVYRKIAPKELGAQKRDVETMPYAELEIELLRQWTREHTFVGKQADRMSAEECRQALDASGRFLLHRIRWFKTIEELGGLHVIGTERHEARRIDNQLRGRSGRQGDNGSSRFFVALDDDLMKMFAGETQMKILSRLGMKEGDSIEHPWLSKSVARAQRKVEERNFQIRKNILEYDEVMEHQRQHFYGLRQRVLEGRDVKGLIFQYVRDAVDDACKEYLDRDYAVKCIAEYAKSAVECSIPHERLRGLELNQIDRALREDAKGDARSMIDVTLGEYIQGDGSDAAVDFDVPGLLAWAKSKFGIELNKRDLEKPTAETRRAVQHMLEEAAYARIDAADLAGVQQYLDPHYGPKQLVHWAKNKFAIDLKVEDVIRSQTDARNHPPRDLLMKQLEDKASQREAEYPVDFVMELTMLMMRQSPAEAMKQLSGWAKRRLDLTLTEDDIKKSNPAKIRETLLEASRANVVSSKLDAEIKAAQACGTDEALEKHLQERFGVKLPDWMRYLQGQERSDAIRARVEGILRGELLHFEQEILLGTLDDQWRQHLHSMDQLRDVINFRAYSQQDPRTEFKREGSRMFYEMLERVRDKITDYIFKVRLSPQMMGLGGPQQSAGPRMVQAAPRVAGAGLSAGLGSAPRTAAPAQGGAIGPSSASPAPGDAAPPAPRPAGANTLFPFIPATGAPRAQTPRPPASPNQPGNTPPTQTGGEAGSNPSA